MPKQESLIKFTGKMDGISFYKNKDGHFARKANGPDKNRILTHPKFQRTRENISEFSSLSITAKIFQAAFKPVSILMDSNLRNRLVKVFRVTVKSAEGIRGQRPVLITEHRSVLKHLELNINQDFTKTCAFRFTSTHNASRNGATITIEPFVPLEMISASASATHFRLVHILGVVPDVVYNSTSQRYESADSFFDGMNQIAFSEYLAAKADQPINIVLECALQGAPPLGEKVSVVQSIGIMLYEKIANVYYPLNQGNAMKVIDLFYT